MGQANTDVWFQIDSPILLLNVKAKLEIHYEKPSLKFTFENLA